MSFTSLRVFLALLPSIATALVVVPFASYAEPDCTVPVTSARVVSTYCVNIEDFPIRSFSAHVSEGSCEGSEQGKTPVLRLFGEAGCEEGVLEAEVHDGDEGKCFGLEGTVKSLTVVCV